MPNRFAAAMARLPLVGRASAGTNFAASIVPQPLARS